MVPALIAPLRFHIQVRYRRCASRNCVISARSPVIQKSEPHDAMAVPNRVLDLIGVDSPTQLSMITFGLMRLAVIASPFGRSFSSARIAPASCVVSMPAKRCLFANRCFATALGT